MKVDPAMCMKTIWGVLVSTHDPAIFMKMRELTVGMARKKSILLKTSMLLRASGHGIPPNVQSGNRQVRQFGALPSVMAQSRNPALLQDYGLGAFREARSKAAASNVRVPEVGEMADPTSSDLPPP